MKIKFQKKLKVPYENEIDYSNVRIVESEDKVPENIIKYYISEYMNLKEIYLIQICKKIEEICNINDLRNLLNNIFEIWEKYDFETKNKNILLPICTSANESTLTFLLQKMGNFIEVSRHAMAGIIVEAIGISEHKNALLIVNNLSLKHKNKKIKNTSNATLDKIAQNRGISREELEDLLIPNYGFKKDKIRFFDYGERKIKAILNTQNEIPTISLFDENGKEIKSLPKASKKFNDNEEMVAEHKEEMKSLKKQLKEVVSAQKIKMSKVLINERVWEVGKWLEIFIENPIMQQFASNLVWKKTNENGEILQTFRYMDDGTFNSVDEEEIEIVKNENELEYITILHPTEIEKEELEKWKEQFEDYEITQPFMQLNSPIYELTEENKNLKEIKDYNEVKFYSAKIKSVMKNFDFTAIVEDAGNVNGYYFYDEKNDITIKLCLDEGFYVGDYAGETGFEKIEFIKGDSYYGTEILELEKVPTRLISLACMMAEMIVGKV